MADPEEPDAALHAALIALGLARPGAPLAATALTGGVASDIWRVETGGHVFAVKRALPKLRVAADWRAPIERNAYEVAWLRLAGEIVPGAAPAILGHDEASGLFAMAYLDPATHPVWKGLLREGHADVGFADEVGTRLARIHAATAGRPDIAAAFDTLAIFHPIRLEPYLEATARRHADVADRLMALSRDTAARRIALVHGDISPKNILAGPLGPVFLDAECAWYGDPAFDLAFCLNHLLLKCLWNRPAAPRFHACYSALAGAYLARVTWEDPAGFEARAAALLPGLFLARVDGKSPVEYITTEKDRDLVRATARPLLMRPVARLDAVRAAWARTLGLETGGSS
jgi:aminoglycoside phosphotransferase (APT) family kinase protein